jgi:uncharacterized protein YacL
MDIHEMYYKLETNRLWFAFLITIIGLAITLLVVYVLLVLGKDFNGEQIAAVVGLFTSVLGTIVGAFLGYQIGTMGTDRANLRAVNSMQVANEAIQELKGHDRDKAAKLQEKLLMI